MNYEMLANLPATVTAPESSWILMADVRGSTEAVRQGRYREVNLIGAACVASIRNSFEQRSVPYVFGGDRATQSVERLPRGRQRPLLPVKILKDILARSSLTRWVKQAKGSLRRRGFWS